MFCFLFGLVKFFSSKIFFVVKKLTSSLNNNSNLSKDYYLDDHLNMLDIKTIF